MNQTVTRASPRHRPGSLARREEIAFFLFASPWLIGFFAWTIGPMVASLVLSLTHYDIITSPQFTGLDNYVKMFTGDNLVPQALKVTVLYALGAVPLQLVTALALALLMNQQIRGITIFRTIYYTPAVIAGVPVALLWTWIFNPDFGIINNLLGDVGIQGPKWLFDETWVIPAFVIMSLWSIGAAMIIYLAGLQGIPQHLYEAAEIDCAGPWTKFANVTIPMISPIIFFNAVMGIIVSFQIFTPAYVMTRGGPDNASLFMGLYLYNNAFEYFQMGYASALAWLVFVVIMGLTLVVIRSSPYWVYYESGLGDGRI
jgi:multiple sugar transport system permease protein